MMQNAPFEPLFANKETKKDDEEKPFKVKKWLKQASKTALIQTKSLFYAFFETLYEKALKVRQHQHVDDSARRRGTNDNSEEFKLISLKEEPQEGTSFAKHAYGVFSRLKGPNKVRSSSQEVPNLHDGKVFSDLQYDLGPEQLMQREISPSKTPKKRIKYDQQLYLHKMFESFHTDDLYDQIIEKVSEALTIAYNQSKQRYLEAHEKKKSQQRQQTSYIRVSQSLQEKNTMEEMNKLKRRVEELEGKLEQQTRDYYTEIAYYKFYLRGNQSQGGLVTNNPVLSEVRFFDETVMISAEHKAMMNERLQEMQMRHQNQSKMFEEAQQKMLARLKNYEKLKPQQFGILDMTTDEIFEAISLIEKNPQVVWELIEKHYKRNFFEGVIVKKYQGMFENRNEIEFNKLITDTKKEMVDEITSIQRQHEAQLKLLKNELTEKSCELISIKDRFQTFQIESQRQEQQNAQQLIQEHDKQAFQRWEIERAGLMEEIADMEKEHAHEGLLLSKERFKNFVFRHTILLKVNKLKEFNKESYEFMKASLEIQQLVKYEIETRVELIYDKLKENLQKEKDAHNETLNQMCDQRFLMSNMERQIALMKRQTEDANFESETFRSNLRFARDKIREIQAKFEIVARENHNLKEAMMNFELKNIQLNQKLEQLSKEQANGLSVLDFQIAFDKADRGIAKWKLLDEINDVKVQELKASLKGRPAGQKPDSRSQQVCTDLQNVTRDIVYKNEHGIGILKQQETQTKENQQIKTFTFAAVQTEEEINEEKGSFDEQEDAEKLYFQNKKDSLRIMKRGASKLSDQLQQESLSSQGNGAVDSFKKIDGLVLKKRMTVRVNLRSGGAGGGQGSRKEGESKDASIEHGDDPSDSNYQNLLKRKKRMTSLKQDSFNKLNKEDITSGSHQLNGSKGRPLSMSSNSSQSDRGSIESDEEENETSNKGIQYGKYNQLKQRRIPAVFSRLWNQNKQRDEKLKQQREQSREKEDADWRMKLAGVNQLQKTFQGMTVYQDPHTGKCFVHINELRQRALQSVNDKGRGRLESPQGEEFHNQVGTDHSTSIHHQDPSTGVSIGDVKHGLQDLNTSHDQQIPIQSTSPSQLKLLFMYPKVKSSQNSGTQIQQQLSRNTYFASQKRSETTNQALISATASQSDIYGSANVVRINSGGFGATKVGARPLSRQSGFHPNTLSSANISLTASHDLARIAEMKPLINQQQQRLIMTPSILNNSYINEKTSAYMQQSQSGHEQYQNHQRLQGQNFHSFRLIRASKRIDSSRNSGLHQPQSQSMLPSIVRPIQNQKHYDTLMRNIGSFKKHQQGILSHTGSQQILPSQKFRLVTSSHKTESDSYTGGDLSHIVKQSPLLGL